MDLSGMVVDPKGGPVLRCCVKAIEPLLCRRGALPFVQGVSAGGSCDGVIVVKKNFSVKEPVKCSKCGLLHGFADTPDGMVYGVCL